MLFLWTGQNAVAHEVDFDQDHHAQHDCQVYQSFNDILFQESISVAITPPNKLILRLALLNISVQPLYYVQARGPPQYTFSRSI